MTPDQIIATALVLADLRLQVAELSALLAQKDEEIANFHKAQ